MVFCTTIFSTNQNLPPICNYPSFPAKIKLKLKFGSGYFQNLPNLNGFYVKDIDGNDVPLSKFNVASKCGLTSSNYSELSQVYAKYKPQGMPGALSVKRDPDVNSVNEDYSYNFNLEENSVPLQTVLLYPEGFKHWLVCVEKPSSRAFSKAQTVDFYVDILTKVLRNEKDAQMCLYHTSSHSDFYGFCCILDEECAKELAAVPGVLSVQPDENFESENKDYGGGRLSPNAPTSVLTDMSKTKLFITGLSFYTSEKTLRAAFEPFGELIEVKIIMDKISKRSKGYAFVEFTSEDAATTALREMNGKIINGWMIVVDRARANPRLSRRS